jgi:hypothetical protein
MTSKRLSNKPNVRLAPPYTNTKEERDKITTEMRAIYKKSANKREAIKRAGDFSNKSAAWKDNFSQKLIDAFALGFLMEGLDKKDKEVG